jgi:hypothetical protein
MSREQRLVAGKGKSNGNGFHHRDTEKTENSGRYREMVETVG